MALVATRYKASQASECTKRRNKLMVKVVVTAKKSLRILNNRAEVQGLVGSKKEREHLLTPKLRCW